MRFLIIILCLSKLTFSNFYLLESKKENIPELVDKYGIDSESFVPNNGKIAFIAEDHIAELIVKHYEIKILSKDYESELEVKNKENNILLENGFSLGSYGAGYHTLDEIYTHLQGIADKFGKIATIDTIGFSVENNPIIALEIGNKESNTGFLLTSLHHAREPGSATTVIYFLHEFADLHSKGNLSIKYLLNNSYLSWIACVNPDGYIYNIKQKPNGGGLWRKNRGLNNGDEFIGVDLNRNYGPEEFWDMPNGGSSTITRSATYRGSEPYSEPETDAVRRYVLRNHFKLALNFHTFGDLVILPNDLEGNLTKDSTYLEKLFGHTRKYNQNVYGIDTISVGYKSRGTHNNFMTNWHRSFPAVTAEVGTRSVGFYADNPETILEQCKENFNFILDSWESIFPMLLFDNDPVLLDKNRDGEIEISYVNLGQQYLEPNYYNIIVNGWHYKEDFAMLNSAESGYISHSHLDMLTQNVSIKYSNNFDGKSNDFRAIFYPKKVGYTNILKNSCFEEKDGLILSFGEFYYEPFSQCSEIFSFSNPKKEEQYLHYEIKYSMERDFDIGTFEISDDKINWEFLPVKAGVFHSGQFELFEFGEKFGYHGQEKEFIYEIFDVAEYKSDSIYLRISLYSDRSRQFEGMEIKDLGIYYPQETFKSVNTPQSSVYFDGTYLYLNNERRFQIFDMQGRVVRNINTNQNKIALDLPVGIYFLKFDTFTQKVIIN